MFRAFKSLDELLRGKRVGAVPGDDAQRVDYERAQGVLVSLQQTEHSPEEVRSRRSQRRSIS